MIKWLAIYANTLLLVSRKLAFSKWMDKKKNKEMWHVPELLWVEDKFWISIISEKSKIMIESYFYLDENIIWVF